MHPLDPWRVAHMLMQQHGENAGLQAAMRVDELNAAGDEEGRRVWMQILDAIDELGRTGRYPGEALQ